MGLQINRFSAENRHGRARCAVWTAGNGFDAGIPFVAVVGSANESRADLDVIGVKIVTA